MIPQRLQHVTDGNELQFLRISKTKTENILIYIYTKSEEKLNLELPITEKELQDCLNKNILKEI